MQAGAYRWSVSVISGIALVLGLGSYSLAIAQPPEPPHPNEIRVGAMQQGNAMRLGAGDELAVELPANPSTGYRWQVTSVDRRVLTPLEAAEFNDKSPLVGAPVTQVLRFVPAAAGQTDLYLAYERPWENKPEPRGTYHLKLSVDGTAAYSLPEPASHSIEPTQDPGASMVSLSVGLLQSAESLFSLAVTPVPSGFNWCTSYGCTPVKNQGPCGSCWAFSVTGVLEQVLKKSEAGVNRDLSEQYLVSCNAYQYGCRGGFFEAHDYHTNVFPAGDFAAGAVYESDLPYQATETACNSTYPHHERLESWSYLNYASVPDPLVIKQAIVDHGPVATAICVGGAFQSYAGGIFQTDDSCKNGINHAVVLVGWDDSQGVWILRNSWGASWGENAWGQTTGERGYMRIKYGTSHVGWYTNYVVYNEANNSSGDGSTGPVVSKVKLFLPVVTQSQ